MRQATAQTSTNKLEDNQNEPAPDLARRLALNSLGSLGIATLLAGCGGGGGDSGDASSSTSSSSTTSTTTTTSTASTTSTTSSTCSVVPEETAGPYPADGSSASNATYNVLALSGIVRSDIRSNIGALTPVAGVALTLTITLTNTQASCAALEGYAIYVWHCSQAGNYSVYTENSIASNYLRGVQATNANGTVSFTTIVPGCYAGRMPHIHIEVYPSASVATSASRKVKTTQLAFPTATLSAIYNANAGYSASVRNLANISFASDNVFSDGTDLEMLTLQSDGNGGYTANITISIAA
ncbi:intradiol ring-cleavage dioxygenase [Variovorax sp. HJSM1_2]|uniref:intradiol ring-cleavage dioxygenase n=1 Tax=Variovorax sp. HJSM1_2 TaxID=3366263 RepID=UPI003BD4D88C